MFCLFKVMEDDFVARYKEAVAEANSLKDDLQ